MMLYIGVDLGTSAVKLLLMDGAGQIKKIVSQDSQNCIQRISAVFSASGLVGTEAGGLV